MPSKRFLTYTIGTSILVGLAACGGVTQFQGGQAFAVAGTPPPPPPPPPPKKEEPPPPPARVELRDNKIDFKDKIQFDNNKATIKPESFGLLKEIADVIKKNPQVKQISVEGHASSEGDPKHNKELSADRAKSVVTYLTTKEGIAADHLVSKGWGSEKPIADNATEEGKEKNRRVEFLVTKADVTQKKVEIDPKTGKEKVVDTKTETFVAPGAQTAPAMSAKPATSAKPAPTTKKP